MKLFILSISIIVLLLVHCKKESNKAFKKADDKPVVVKATSKQYLHPFYIRYKTYRKDLNTLFISHLNHVNYNGC